MAREEEGKIERAAKSVGMGINMHGCCFGRGVSSSVDGFVPSPFQISFITTALAPHGRHIRHHVRCSPPPAQLKSPSGYSMYMVVARNLGNR